MTKSIAKKSTTGSLPPAVPIAITPTFSPWTHTSDDSYIYQLSLVLATATVFIYNSSNVDRVISVDRRVGPYFARHKKVRNFPLNGENHLADVPRRLWSFPDMSAVQLSSSAEIWRG